MIKLTGLIFTLIFIIGCGSEGSNSKADLTEKSKVQDTDESQTLIEELQSEVKTEIVQLERYPTLTLILMPKGELQESIKKLIAGGGELIYDPNNGGSNTIPFYIASLTPEQINDTKFMKGLNLKAASIESNKTSVKPIQTKITSGTISPENFIPTESVKISELVNDQLSRAQLGEGITVAVIDTGIDASHPGFNGRVDYWYDAAEEVQVELQAVKLTSEGEITINNTTYKAPVGIAKGELFAGVMDEKELSAQLSADGKDSAPFMDINFSDSSSKYLIMAVKTKNDIKVYFDADADLAFNKKESKAFIDYNKTTIKNRADAMVEFPTRNSIVKYPVLIQSKKNSLIVGLGKTGGMHGTHVAGIIAANDPANNLVGAAPKAKLMALKVCTAISCTDSAIIKALYKSFYNDKGLIPDVVNISLGSHEKYKKGIYSYILDDLSAKFGTIFFVSASNSGPGFRSLNHIGNTGAVVTVGANVSKKTLDDQYNLPEGSEIDQETLLFFSSLGPSYTSEMKPNIIAPGAAISTVLTAEGYLSQANGTSMSSPLAAGTMAAILSNLKKEDKSLFRIIDTQRKINLSRTSTSEKTLLPYVFGMRDALQSTATELSDLTAAQQGYGLISAGVAKDALLKIMTELNDDTRDYFEVVLNNYKKTYERETISKMVMFELSPGFDGERPLVDFVPILAAGVDVVLHKVEIINFKGKVSKLKNDKMLKYFSIVDQGSRDNKLKNTHVTFNNRRTKAFYSHRHIEAMKTGMSYLAHYQILYKGVVVQNILDTVHMGYKMQAITADVPAIDPSISEISAGFFKKNVKIETNVFHRYPVNVEKSVQSLNIKIAVERESEGLLYVQLYNPNGKEVAFEYAMNNPINGYVQADFDVSTIDKEKVLGGIWELTISSSSSTWLADSKYDLLIASNSFGAVKSEYKLSKDKELKVPVSLDGESISKVVLHELQEVEVKEIDVKSGYYSFYPISLEKDTLTVSMQTEDTGYWGNLRTVLFKKVDGVYTAFKEGYKSKKNTLGLEFSGLNSLKGEVYIGFDTITNYEVDSINDNADKIMVEFITKSDEKIEIDHAIDSFVANDLSILTFKLKSDITSGKEYRTKVSLFSGKVTTVIDNEGHILTTMDPKTKTDTFTLKFK